MKRMAWFAWLAGVLLPISALAAAPAASIELGMRVSGTLTLNAGGGVTRYVLHAPEQLPAGVRGLIDSALPAWTFTKYQAAGKPVGVAIPMTVRISGKVTGTSESEVGGKPVQQNQVQIGIAGVALQCPATGGAAGAPAACDPNASLGDWQAGTPRELPAYPSVMRTQAVGGAVHLYLQLDSLGRVMQIAVRRVDVYARVKDPDAVRAALRDAVLAVARRWQFRIPTAGPGALLDHWVAEQTVKFYVIGGHADVAYGKWLAYLPGPGHAIVWADANPDAVMRLPVMTVSTPPPAKGAAPVR